MNEKQIIIVPLSESAEESTTYINAFTVLKSSLTGWLNSVEWDWDWDWDWDS